MRSKTSAICLLTVMGLAHATTVCAEGRVTAPPAVRARSLGVPFDGTPGPFNAITDVEGVAVGHTTLISGEGKLEVGQGPVRTGVTVILPRGREQRETPVFAGWYSLNGNGEMTGTTWIEESGFLEGPITITNTHSVGVARDAVIRWRVLQLPPVALDRWWSNPVVAETYDGWLNDINGFHIKPEDVFHALDTAQGGSVQEGNVGGGTGMRCNGYKGGIGTASRRLSPENGGYTIGVLVQCNYGTKRNLRIAGIPVGRELPDEEKLTSNMWSVQEVGSIIVVVATDAPLMPHQLKRIARRVSLGLGRTGSTSGNSSGDIFIAFTTANPRAAAADSNPSGIGSTVPQSNSALNREVDFKALPNGLLNPLFDATVEATEEAIVNAMVAAEAMTGRDGHHVDALPHEALRNILQAHERLEP